MAISTRGYALLFVTAVGWSGAWIIARAAAHEASPSAITVGRFAVAAIALLPAWFLLERGLRFRPTRGDVGLLLGMALTGIVGYTLLFLSGIALAPASDGAVITPALAGVFAMLIAWPALGQRPSTQQVAGALLALAGVVLVGWAVFGGVGPGSERITGDLLFVASAGMWGVYAVLGRRAADRIPPVTGILLASVLGVAVLTPVVILLQGPGVFVGWSGLAWANVLYLGVVATAVSFVTFYLGVKRVGVASAAPFYGLVPVLVVVQAAWLLNEQITLLHGIGGALVFLGIALPTLAARRRAPGARAEAPTPLTPEP
ncbi:MAG: DMT family transporter [Candidatus Thermoplasmatota archaeon]|nr:DMT family transporter [Candidatus Thermoplasmatota archaeon]